MINFNMTLLDNYSYIIKGIIFLTKTKESVKEIHITEHRDFHKESPERSLDKKIHHTENVF